MTAPKPEPFVHALVNPRMPCTAHVSRRCPACGRTDQVTLRCDDTCPVCRGRDKAPARLAAAIPRVPVRHWVLGVPRSWQPWLLDDPRHCRRLATAFVDVVLDTIAARCPDRPRGFEIRGGAASIVHRFGARLDANVHIHVLALDGIYCRRGPDLPPEFLLAEPPRDFDLEDIARRVGARVVPPAHLVTSLSHPGSTRDRVHDLAPRSLSVRQRCTTGPRAAKLDASALTRLADAHTRAAASAIDPSSRSIDAHGFHVHQSARVDGHQRTRVVDLCRYLQRPVLEPHRLELVEGDRYVYRLPQPFHDGTVAIEFSPDELASTLQQLVTPSRAGRVSYHGVLLPHAAQRWFLRPTQLCLPGTTSAPRSVHKPPQRTSRDVVAPPSSTSVQTDLPLREPAPDSPRPSAGKVVPSSAFDCPDCGAVMLPTALEEASADDISRSQLAISTIPSRGEPLVSRRNRDDGHGP